MLNVEHLLIFNDIYFTVKFYNKQSKLRKIDSALRFGKDS